MMSLEIFCMDALSGRLSGRYVKDEEEPTGHNESSDPFGFEFVEEWNNNVYFWGPKP